MHYNFTHLQYVPFTELPSEKGGKILSAFYYFYVHRVTCTQIEVDVFNFLNTVLRSKFRKVNRQRKVEKEYIEKTAKTSFSNSDYPLLHTLA